MDCDTALAAVVPQLPPERQRGPVLRERALECPHLRQLVLVQGLELEPEQELQRGPVLVPGLAVVPELAKAVFSHCRVLVDPSAWASGRDVWKNRE